MVAQALALAALVPAFALAAGVVAVPTVGSLLLIAIFGHETRRRDLRELEMLSPAEFGSSRSASQD